MNERSFTFTHEVEKKLWDHCASNSFREAVEWALTSDTGETTGTYCEKSLVFGKSGRCDFCDKVCPVLMDPVVGGRRIPVSAVTHSHARSGAQMSSSDERTWENSYLP